jgi:glyoxylase-like metal-dependent hydrolase (beta-lactamase superfamily II)
MEAEMRKPIHGIIAGASVAMALILTVAVAAAQALAPQFDLTKVTDHVYSFRSGIHRAMVVVTSDGVIVTDPINSGAAKNMMDEIRKVTDKPVKFVIYSHNHWDHVAGAKIFKDQGAKIIQHALAAQKTRPHPDVVPADETFSDDTHVVTLGDQTIELTYVGPSHGAGMIVMRVPKERVLNIVDICTPQRIGFRNFPDTSPQDTIKALRKVEALDFDRIVPGHGPASAPKAEVTASREYLEDLTRAVSAAKEKTGNPFAFDQITELVKADLRPKYGQWGEFDNWMMMNVDRILLEQRLGY